MSRPQSHPGIPSNAPSIYSTYLCREPIGDVALLINNGPDEYTSLLRTLQRSADHWAEKDQTRTVERLQFEIARLHMQNKQWQRAMRTLVPLWQTLTWRQAGWWNILEEVDWALKKCAENVRDAETLVAVEWELMNRSLTKRQDSGVDFRQALDRLEGTQARPRSVIRSENVLSCVSSTFAFANPEGNVGVPLDLQLVLSSHAHAGSAAINLAQIRIAFEGGLKNMSIHHKPMDGNDKDLASTPVQLQRIPLQSSSSELESTPTSPTFAPSHTLSAFADLVLAPGATKILSLTCLPRDAGEVEVSSITIYAKEEKFDLELVVSEDEQLHQDSFWESDESDITKKPVKADRSSAVKILPKPPKMRLTLPTVRATYYVDEEIVLDLEITNEEDEPAKGSLDVRLLGPLGTHATFSWMEASGESDPLEGKDLDSIVEGGHQRLPARQINVMEPFDQQKHQIRVHSASPAAEYSLQVEARYSLLSDPETPISKIFTADIVFVQPFEPFLSFAPVVHPDPWPDYFSVADEDEAEAQRLSSSRPIAHGLIQRWSLTSRLTSLATETLIIEDILPSAINEVPSETTSCRIFPSATEHNTSSHEEAAYVLPSAVHTHTHTLDVQKVDLEDRHSVSLDFVIRIRFRRQSSPSSSFITTTTLPLLSLPIPFGEPRCLASSQPQPSPSSSTTTTPQTSPHPIPLTYTLENPSSYTLTFNLSMDNNEDFAFAGPKSLNVQLLPLTRRTVAYKLLPLGTGKEGRWIYPHCLVIDTGFRKTLRVLAAQGVRNDRSRSGGGVGGGIGVWVEGSAS